MGFCKESENGICKPLTCRKPYCLIGEKLREIFETPPKCAETCLWIKQGIDGVNSCKDASCPIGNTVVSLRKK